MASYKKLLMESGFKIDNGTTRINGKQVRFDIIEQNN